MLFFGDTHRANGKSHATKALLFILLASFFIIHRYPNGFANPRATLHSASLIPARFQSREAAFMFDKLTPLPISLVWSQVLCASGLQLLLCCTFFWLLGTNIEARMGIRRFLLLLAICTIGGELAFVLGNWRSEIGTVGPTAAIAGLLGAYLAYYPKNKFRLEFNVPGRFFRVLRFPFIALIPVWILAQLPLLLIPSNLDLLAVYAQITGFLFGILLTKPHWGQRRNFKVFHNQSKGPFGRD